MLVLFSFTCAMGHPYFLEVAQDVISTITVKSMEAASNLFFIVDKFWSYNGK